MPMFLERESHKRHIHKPFNTKFKEPICIVNAASEDHSVVSSASQILLHFIAHLTYQPLRRYSIQTTNTAPIFSLHKPIQIVVLQSSMSSPSITYVSRTANLHQFTRNGKPPSPGIFLFPPTTALRMPHLHRLVAPLGQASH